MQDTDSGDGDRGSASRRGYLRSLGAVAALAFGTTDAVATGRKRTPNPYTETGVQGTSPESDVYLTHAAELPSVRRRLSAYERTRDAGHVLSARLREELAGDSPDRVDLAVGTVGERASVTTRGGFGRRIHGWRPTAEEVKRLAAFGDVVYVPEVGSTKVGLSDVATSDLGTLAGLDFVLEVGHDPHLELSGRADDAAARPQDLPTADALATSDHMGFDVLDFDLEPPTKVGILGDGYAGRTDWSEPWAESVGIDADGARDFLGDDWRTGGTHGTNVADAIAYVLKDGDPHSNLFVPLQVWEPDYGVVKGSVMRAAIEYALKNDVPVMNISVETTENEKYCPSTVCEELESYASAGYVAVVASGNDALDTEVCHPATSHFGVSVGGYADACRDGYHRHDKSNYGKIRYFDPERGRPYCPWCYEAAGDAGFQPNVYGSYGFLTDAGVPKGGTSFSAPMVTAAGAIRHSVHGSGDYGDVLADFNGMSDKSICESEASRQGDVLHVPDVS